MPDHRSGHAHARTTLLALALLVGLLAAPVSRAATPFRGVNLHSLWPQRSADEMYRELDYARDTNGNVVRLDVGWATLETAGKGRLSDYYVQELDAFMGGLRARGMKVVVTLLQTPCWASSAPETLKQGCAGAWWDRGVAQYPPTDPRTYADIARWLVLRYGGTLAALEVWNEPNLGPRFWVSKSPARDYVGLLKAAYAGIKAACSDVPVLAGALAAADRDFLDDLYANGIRGSYDGISLHPYNERRDPTDLWQQQWIKYTFLPGIESIRESQLAHGDDKPLWVTEFGWTTTASSLWQVSMSEQADYLARAFRILDGLAYVRAAVAYELRDGGSDPANIEDNFGLLRHDFSEKPAYTAVRAALAPAPMVRRTDAPATLTVNGTSRRRCGRAGRRRAGP
jgi:hypothetical protein